MTAIYYHPEAYTTSGSKLMGRNAAGNSFLRGFFEHYRSDGNLYAQVSGKNHFELFSNTAKKFGRTEIIKPIFSENLGSAELAKNIYHPGPAIGEQAYNRHPLGHTKWALCGITHTTSSAFAMDAISSWITSPVQPWDAVICTSSSVKANVETILQAEIEYLKDRLNIHKVVLPQLPVIPLGVHAEDFDYNTLQRDEARASLSAKEDELIVLYTGRLSFHAKAHPLAMYQALEVAAKESNKKVILVECGWHANDHIQAAFSAGAELVSPNVTVIFLDGRIEKNRDIAWASADVFCSLSDNIQETFGIVPIEAMAAGLPVIVSDWDGYKDTVRHGVDGFRIPTLAPGPGLAGDLAHRHALGIDTYDMYCGHTSSLVALHSQKLKEAFIRLFQSKNLRLQMGEAGKLRAHQTYDWKNIIPTYEELWSEQTNIRIAETNRLEHTSNQGKGVQNTWPARLDPTVSFAKYPTQHLTVSTHLKLTEATAIGALEKLAIFKKLAMVNYAHYIFPTESEIATVFKTAESRLPDGCIAADLLSGVSDERKPIVLRGLAWLCKLGLLQF
ncbi:glycosyltransferase family 4 protein [Gammaproteobacteria bacterium]|nr:glycosyltransferase family 4 protein [Gammaproteobacteria bacterium]